MTYHLGIDPGVREVAWVVISESSIVDSGVVENIYPSSRRRDLQRIGAVEMAHDAAADISRRLDLSKLSSATVEGQQLYQGSNVDPLDLILLAQVAGACLGAVAATCSLVHLFSPSPREWKGTVPKKIHQGRLLRRYGYPYAVGAPKSREPYCYPADGRHFPSTDQSDGFRQTDYKHLVDALGLAEWGMRQFTRA